MDTLLSASSLLPFVIGVVVGGITYFFICRSQNATPSVPIANKLISNKMALDMISNYSCSNGDDTVSGHLELGVLLTYINQISSQCTSIGMTMSGLEYYFARYDEDAVNDSRSTIVIYPTFEDANGNHVPFDPYESTNGSPVTVVALNATALGSRNGSARWTRNFVLDKSNMSPPRQNTI